MRTAFIDTLCEAAARDPRLWLITGDLGFSVFERFRERFPDRFLNVGVAEQNMAGVAAAMAMDGLRPFIYSINNFTTFRCLEQIRNDIVYHRAPVTVVSVGAGYTYGSQGYTHHGVEDIAIMRALPDMTIVAPCDAAEARAATLALAAYDGPAYLRLSKSGEPPVHTAPVSFDLGRVNVLRDGTDATILGHGAILRPALDAAIAAAGNGHSVGVMSVHTLKPLDGEAILAAARRTGRLLVVEEHSVVGGLGSAVAELVAEAGIALTRFRRLGAADRPSCRVAGQAALRAGMGSIASALDEMLLA